jgi:YVTN family beta-propeller protein
MKKIAMILCIASALGLCLSGFATAAPFAYIRAADDYSLAVLDTATNTLSATVHLSGGSGIYGGVAVSPDGSRVYVPNRRSNTVSVISTATDTVTATVPVPGGPVAIGVFIGPDTVRPTHATGKIVVVNDDWVLSNTGFAAPNDPGKFATNVAAWFTGGRPGNFHAYSDHFGLTGSSLASAMTSAGHTWTTGTTGFTFDLATLQKYDGIFLLVAPADDEVLIDYVESGGNVYLAYSGDPSHLDEQYNTFVNHFGLGLGVINNGIAGNVAISSPHPIFASVDSLYNVNGSDILDLAPADPGQTVVVSYNGHGLYAVYDGGTSFTQADLAGTWYFEVFEDNISANAPYWAFGTLMVDTSGNITDGTAVNDSGVVRTFTSGSLIIDSTGQVSGTLAASGGITGVLPHGKLDAGKNILTLVDSSNDYRGLFVMTMGGGTFTQADLAGTWYFQVYEDNVSSNAPYWGSGTLIVDTAGNVTGGTAVNDSGVFRTFTGGSLIIDSTGQVSGTLAASGGVTGTLPHGKLDPGKNILTLVDSSNDYRGLFVMTRGGGTFTQADLAGTWYFQVIADSITANAPYWGSGTMIVNTTGNVIGGTAVNDSGVTKTLTGGSLTIDSVGQVSGTNILSDGTVESLPYGKLDAGKTILTMVNSDPAYRGLLVAIKGSTFDQAMLTVAKAGNGAGIITSVPSGIHCDPDCSESFAVGTEITLTATPSTGYAFSSWSGSISSTSNPVNLTMDSAKTVTANFVILIPTSDLIITAVTGPTTAIPGASITIGATTKNQGTGTAAASTTKFYWSTNNTYSADDIYLGSMAIPALAAGATNTGTIAATVPSACSQTTWYIIARADTDGAVPETNENNNNKAKSVKTGPDLIVSTVTAPTTSGAGLTITVTDTTKNDGGCPAGASNTNLYLSTNSPWDAGDTYLGSRAVPALAAGATNTMGSNVTIPAGTATGTWYIIARADANGVVTETSETNNNKAKSIKIGPDLIVSSITGPLSAVNGSTITIGDTTKNSGGGAAGASTTRLYLSTNTTYDAGDILLRSRAVPALNAGTTNKLSASVTLPSVTPGAYYIIAVSDAGSVVVETNETNNTKYKAITITP